MRGLNRSSQRGAVTLIAVILLITVITFSVLTAALYTNASINDAVQQDDGVAALFLAESGVESAIYNLSVSSACDDAGVGAGATQYTLGRGYFEIVSGVPTGSLCRITARGTIGSVARTVQADARFGGGAITFGSDTSNSDNGNAIDLDVPAGAAAGDLLFAQISVRGGSGQVITAPAGWALIPTDGRLDAGTELAQAIYYRVAGAAEPASYTWQFSSSDRSVGAMLHYSGVDATTPVDASGGTSNTSSVNFVDAPSLTTTVPNTLLIGFFGHARSGSLTTPGGMTLRSSANSGGGPSGVKLRVADETIVAIGPTGGRTSNASNSAASIGHAVALRPGGTSGVVSWQEP